LSHFTVMVIGDNLEEQLAPYQENNMGNCPQEYLEFNDEEDEYLQKYENDTTEKVVRPDDRLLNTWDEEFQKPGTIGLGSDTHEVPKNLEKRQVPFKELYSTFEEFMKDWCGFDERDPEMKRYGYWNNPNTKWDWYSVGGRWTGFFKLKKGKTGQTGKPGLMTKPNIDPNYADQALKGNIDFESMQIEAYEKAVKHWDLVAKYCGGEMPKYDYTWNDILKMQSMTIERKRKFYHEQEGYKKFVKGCAKGSKDKSLDEEDRNYLHWAGFNGFDDFITTREKFGRKAAIEPFITFAVLKEGEWFERGEMGWWANISNEKEKGKWEEEFFSLLNDLPDDTLLTVVDCHI